MFLLAFFVAPLVDNARRSVALGGGTLDNYRKLLLDPYYLGVLGQTLWLGALVTVVCLLLGYPLAYFLVRHAGRWRGVMIFLLVAPLLTSIIMRTFGWRVVLSGTHRWASLLAIAGSRPRRYPW